MWQKNRYLAKYNDYQYCTFFFIYLIEGLVVSLVIQIFKTCSNPRPQLLPLEKPAIKLLISIICPTPFIYKDDFEQINYGTVCWGYQVGELCFEECARIEIDWLFLRSEEALNRAVGSSGYHQQGKTKGNKLVFNICNDTDTTCYVILL